MNKENKLGMGLGALLSTTNNKNETNNNVQKINISQIVPNPLQPRKNFKNEELKELSSSIKNQGLIQPIIVKPTDDNQFQIIAGERRWRACQLNGMHEVDCVIKEIDEKSIFFWWGTTFFCLECQPNLDFFFLQAIFDTILDIFGKTKSKSC